MKFAKKVGNLRTTKKKKMVTLRVISLTQLSLCNDISNIIVDTFSINNFYLLIISKLRE